MFFKKKILFTLRQRRLQMKKLPCPMNLIKVTPKNFDYLDSDLKKEGYGSRQHFER